MKKFLTIAIAAIMALGASAQENQIKRIPSKGYDPNQQNYTTFERGVWFAAEALAVTHAISTATTWVWPKSTSP